MFYSLLLAALASAQTGGAYQGLGNQGIGRPNMGYQGIQQGAGNCAAPMQSLSNSVLGCTSVMGGNELSVGDTSTALQSVQQALASFGRCTANIGQLTTR